SRPPLPPQPDVLRHPVTPVSADGPAAVDGHSDYGWNGQADQTLWTGNSVTIDLGKVYGGLDTFTYLPRQDTETAYSFAEFVQTGNVTGYRISASVNGTDFREVAA